MIQSKKSFMNSLVGNIPGYFPGVLFEIDDRKNKDTPTNKKKT